MTDQTYSVLALARPLIEQCRRDIEAGFHHLEAARDMLRRTRWLVARWEAQREAYANVGAVTLANFDAARQAMFVAAKPEPRRRRRKSRRSRADVARGAARRIRPRSASG
jgi:hypothetical protein